MPKGKDERHNSKRQVDKQSPWMKLILEGLPTDPRDARRKGKEYLAAKSEAHDASGGHFAHPEYMEEAELRAEQIKEMRDAQRYENN